MVLFLKGEYQKGDFQAHPSDPCTHLKWGFFTFAFICMSVKTVFLAFFRLARNLVLKPVKVDRKKLSGLVRVNLQFQNECRPMHDRVLKTEGSIGPVMVNN